MAETAEMAAGAKIEETTEVVHDDPQWPKMVMKSQDGRKWLMAPRSGFWKGMERIRLGHKPGRECGGLGGGVK